MQVINALIATESALAHLYKNCLKMERSNKYTLLTEFIHA